MPTLRHRGRASAARGVDQHRDRAEDQRHADDVVERLAGLELDQVLGAERDRAADQALRADAVGPADRVGGGQAEREPAEVEQRREDVAVEGEQRDRVHDLGVRRVERGEEDRVEVVDRAEVRPVGEPGRERHVVPERVGAVHAPGERCRASAPSRRRRPPRRPPAASQTAIRDAGGAGGAGDGPAAAVASRAPRARQRPSSERAGDHRPAPRRRRRCRAARRGRSARRSRAPPRPAAPARPSSRAAARAPRRQAASASAHEDQRQLERAEQVGAGVERALGGRGDAERRAHARLHGASG